MKRKQITAKITAWIRKHKKQVYIGLGVLVLVLAGTGLALAMRSSQTVERTDPQPQTQEKKITTAVSPLTGLTVSPADAERPVTSIIIENSPDARPQSGLHKAGVVFESIAEGGITRFVTFYQESRPDPVGPVRSLRPYFIDWVMAYDASIAHVGGSAKALKQARQLNLKDLDQFQNGSSYYRTTDRYAPHNMYTNFDLLDKLNKAKGYTGSDFKPVERKEPKPLKKPKAKNISINVSSYLYQVDYTYKKSCNCYLRSMAGTPHVDRESKQRIKPKNVVVLNVPVQVVANGYYDYDLVGKGKATVFLDGKVIKGTWHKKSRSAMLTLKHSNGKPLALNPGQTWYTAIDTDQNVEYSP